MIEGETEEAAKARSPKAAAEANLVAALEQALGAGSSRLSAALGHARTYLAAVPDSEEGAAKVRAFGALLLSSVPSPSRPAAAPPSPQVPSKPLRAQSVAAVPIPKEVVVELRGGDLAVEVSPTDVEIVPPPEPTRHEDFEGALAGLLRWRVDRATGFFHRRHPVYVRPLPPPFLLSPLFSRRLDAAIGAMIVPRMLKSRSIRMIGAKYPLSELDSATLWEALRKDRHDAQLRAAWESAWGELRQELVVREEKGEKKQVLRATPDLLALRAALEPPPADPSDPFSGPQRDGSVFPAYSLPKISNRELDLFVSLLDPDFERDDLERTWTRLRQIAEQEYDTRFSYQERAREGALRDTLLHALDVMPDRTGEFVALLCHFVFRPVGMHFLDGFVKSKGQNEKSRRERVPYICAHIEGPGSLERREEERRERAALSDAAREALRRRPRT